jgi:crotonobetainyl-CoA:carnitine CoA-transferase CaiB-like acyl-CoA transferase
MPLPFPDEILRSTTDAVLKAAEFDSKIADDKLQYSAWILAVATAGFAIATTQSDKILAGAMLASSVGTLVVDTAAGLFGLSAIIGALVKNRLNDRVEAIRQATTFILRQQMLLQAGALSIPSGDAKAPADLLRKLLTAKYLSEEEIAIYEKCETKQARAERFAARLLIAQQYLVGCGYLALFIAHMR